MGKRGTAVGETEAQICLLCGNLFHEVRRYRQDDPLMDGIVDLGQLVTFILIDDKEIPRGNRIETIVDQELFAAAKQTLIIVTKRPEDVYEAIAEITHHDATLIKGEGCYSKQECDVLYSVVGRDEVNKVMNTVRKTDPQAFVNMIRTENLAGRFYQRPND